VCGLLQWHLDHDKRLSRHKAMDFYLPYTYYCAFYNYYHIVPEPTSINSYIDNKPLIQRLSYGRETSIRHVDRRDSALIREINQVLDSLAITITRNYVKSHQYDQEPDYDLIPLATTNTVTSATFRTHFSCARGHS